MTANDHISGSMNPRHEWRKGMEQERKAADDELQKKLERWPSLRKFDELGEDAPESHDGREERLLEFIKTRPKVDQFRASPLAILQAMDQFAAEQDFLISIDSDKTRDLTSLLVEEKPKALVELGGYAGYSAIFFADQMQRHASDVHVWSLEFEPRFAKIA